MKNKKTDIAESEENISESNKDFSAPTIESSLDTSFFYTNDKFINLLDNEEILLHIRTKYPDLNETSDDPIIKKKIVCLLDDEVFVLNILKHYNLSIFELFSILYKLFSSIFKGPYLKKLKNVLIGKKYLNNGRKKHDY